MEEILEYLKSPGWWFSVVIMGLIVGVVANRFLDWVGTFSEVVGRWRLRRSRKAKRKYLSQLRYLKANPDLISYFTTIWQSYLLGGIVFIVWGFIVFPRENNPIQSFIAYFLLFCGVVLFLGSNIRGDELHRIRKEIYGEMVEISDEELDEIEKGKSEEEVSDEKIDEKKEGKGERKGSI